MLQYISELPDDSTLDEIIYCFYVREKIAEGKAAARRGEIISQEEFVQRMNQWSEKLIGHSLL